jgi:hypothetical protein
MRAHACRLVLEDVGELRVSLWRDWKAPPQRTALALAGGGQCRRMEKRGRSGRAPRMIALENVCEECGYRAGAVVIDASLFGPDHLAWRQGLRRDLECYRLGP